MAKGTVKDVKDFFGMGLPEMKAEWIGKEETDPTKILTEKDKEQILNGLGDKTLNY